MTELQCWDGKKMCSRYANKDNKDKGREKYKGRLSYPLGKPSGIRRGCDECRTAIRGRRAGVQNGAPYVTRAKEPRLLGPTWFQAFRLHRNRIFKLLPGKKSYQILVISLNFTP